MTRWIASLALVFAASAAAQPQAAPPNALLLVAKPSLRDPNFRETVILVTQARDFNTVGVILNRPGSAKNQESGRALGIGGPVLRSAVVALFEEDGVPASPAFPILKGIYLSMHPGILKSLLKDPGRRYRLFSGFSGWAPRQLESEMKRGGWYMLPATKDVLFREDTRGLWRELLEKARKSGTSPHVQHGNPGIYFPA